MNNNKSKFEAVIANKIAKYYKKQHSELVKRGILHAKKLREKAKR